MEHTYLLNNLDCANCAAKIEAKFNAHPQVEKAVIVFPTRQLRLTAEDPDGLIAQLQEIGRTIEPDFTISTEDAAHSHCHEHTECSCDHDHHDHHHHEHEAKDNTLTTLFIGAGLFVLGLAASLLQLSLLAAVLFVGGYLVLGFPVLRDAGKHLLKGHVLDENFLMSLATLGAIVIGEFPEAVGVMLFYRVGQWFEHLAVSRSRSQIMEAVDLRPEVVTLVSGEVIPARQANIGDLLQIRPGDRIPLDGVVTSGSSRIDTSPITGEPVPIFVEAGSEVISGCVNQEGLLTVRVEKPLSESMVTRILNSVESAAASKPKIDRFITRFAKVFTPVVILLALGVAIIPSLFTGNWEYWIYTALSFLVMSCPCALVLSIPLAFYSGIGAGSKEGILFKGGLSIESMANIQAVVLDKTGTLTQGNFTVQEGDNRVLALCASCEQYSTHPIAKSILAAAKDRGLPLEPVTDVEEISGHGIVAKLENSTFLCGNEKLLTRFGICAADLPETKDGTRVYLAQDGNILGSLLISDTIKPDARAAVSRLKEQNISVAMFTGDAESSANAVARQLGIDRVHAKLLPEDKLRQLQQLRQQAGCAMFVGDGINDAPVLAGADVGAAMGTGADAAIEAADVVYLTSEVSAIPRSLAIAKKTQAIARQNVIFSLGVKALVMILGLLGYASMWAAVFADSGVAMLCVLNSLQILYRKKEL
ncbi:MAG: cadmium-translocating P-type ATPase [Oscillospiraceae bacterium]|nr:cadmium-translocating P-type ATPase [Oscillospiraceae bacterium]